MAKQPIEDWAHLPWRKLERAVYRLQTRIFRASERGNVQAVHSLQRLLMKSEAARCLAVRRVTQDNQGKNTAGVDGVKAVRPVQRRTLVALLGQPAAIRPRPTRRVWIPKPGTTEKRPLGIPVMRDRAHQALVKLALEPEWEARFEPNSYGFRPGRSTHDAIEAIFQAIRLLPRYVLDADIQACLEPSSHCPRRGGKWGEKVAAGLGDFDAQTWLTTPVHVDSAHLAVLDTLQHRLARQPQHLHRRPHWQPAWRRLLREPRP